MLRTSIIKTTQTLFLLGLLLALAVFGPLQTVFAPRPALAAGRPNTIPALREWTDGAGSYTFSAASRIVYNGSGLAGDAATFAGDLLALTGFTIATVNGSSPAAGDIYLTLGATDSAIGNEGYLLTISTTSGVSISAKTNAGAFYGTRTMLQLLKQNFTIAAGSARDWPDYPLRGLQVDNGRKYFTVQWLKNQVRDLAYVKYNYFHWHLSDNEGFRIESTTHPEIVTPPYLTKAEVTDIINLANQYHLMIVPEIDTPAHTKAILNVHPELKLGANADKLDISLPGSYALVGDLLNEYLPLFPGPYWHAGADEYLGNGGYDNFPQLRTFAQQQYGPAANGQDSFNYWNNWVNSQVKAHGKTMHAWAEALVSITPAASSLDTDIVLQFWTSGPTPALTRGNRVVNANRGVLYYVLGAGSYKFSPSTAYDWDPSKFSGETIAPLQPLNLGAHASIWCDNPGQKTEDQIATETMNTLRVLAQNEWGSPKLVSTYTSFAPIITALGRAPGWTTGAATPTPTRTNTPTGPTATPTLTNTPMPPTNTPTRTNTPTAGPSPTPTQTNTSAPPTNTPTSTNTSIPPTNTPTPGSSTNLALNRPVVASSIETASFPAVYAVDGNLGTRWSSAKTDNEWIYVDLGSTFTISRVLLNWESAYGKGYNLQTSNDAVNWTTIFTTTTGNGGIDDLIGLSGSGRYVRMLGTNRATHYGYSLWEFEVYQ
jgi:hexosaminidase